MNTYKLDDVVVVIAEKPSGCDDLNTCGDIGMIVDVCTDDKEPYYQVHTGNSAFYLKSKQKTHTDLSV